MSSIEANSCKLPLLDGDDTTGPRLLTTEWEFEATEMLQKCGIGADARFNDMLCTAWGLLLRCYTGQDNVSFHFQRRSIEDPVSNLTAPREYHSIFRMAFHEDDSLSTCVARAKDGYAENERESPSLPSTVSDSRSIASRSQNTHICVQDAVVKDMQDVFVQKVFQSAEPDTIHKTGSDICNRETFGCLRLAHSAR